MRLGAFEVREPVPELAEPHALTVIPSWIDVGASASLTLSRFESKFGGDELARLNRPGEYFDFTRYRPTLSLKEGASEVNFTNAVITYGKGHVDHDFVFLRLPEPHTMADAYIESVAELLRHFGVKRYGLLGSVYDMVPYTRPLLLTGSASSPGLQNSLAVAEVVSTDYQGPTTILYLIGQHLLQAGIETYSLMVHLPGFLTFEKDYRGEKRLMEAVGSLYGLTMPQEDIEKAKQQDEQFNLGAEQILQQHPQLKIILKQLEDNYDARVKKDKEEIRLSPEVEKFLKELEGRFGQGWPGDPPNL